jgi:hypothetical protein
MTSIWNDFGFRESPYATDHLPPSSEGERLLVGRDAELGRLRTFLRSSARHPTLEGENGVGKTSLVNVAGYQARREFEQKKTGQLLIPLERPFQLTNTDDAQSFRRTVFFEVARGFIRNHDLLKSGGLDVPDVGAIDTWLNTAVIRGGGGGVSVAGFGGSGSRTQAPNTSAGSAKPASTPRSTAGFATRFPPGRPVASCAWWTTWSCWRPPRTRGSCSSRCATPS